MRINRISQQQFHHLSMSPKCGNYQGSPPIFISDIRIGASTEELGSKSSIIVLRRRQQRSITLTPDGGKHHPKKCKCKNRQDGIVEMKQHEGYLGRERMVIPPDYQGVQESDTFSLHNKS